MNIDMLILYTVVAFFYVISPGPAIFLAIANSLSNNMRAMACLRRGTMARWMRWACPVMNCRIGMISSC